MKDSIHRLLCAALALMLLFGTAENLYRPANERAADESLFTVLGLADPDAVPAWHAAPANEPAPEAGTSDDNTEEPDAPELTAYSDGKDYPILWSSSDPSVAETSA